MFDRASVDVLHGFSTTYHLAQVQNRDFYDAEVCFRGSTRYHRLCFHPALLGSLLGAVFDTLGTVLEADDASADACLNKLTKGEFPPDVLSAAQAAILLPAHACEPSTPGRSHLLNQHPLFQALASRFREERIAS